MKKSMKLAWKNANYGSRIHGGKASQYIADSMRLASKGVDLDQQGKIQGGCILALVALAWGIAIYINI